MNDNDVVDDGENECVDDAELVLDRDRECEAERLVETVKVAVSDLDNDMVNVADEVVDRERDNENENEFDENDDVGVQLFEQDTEEWDIDREDDILLENVVVALMDPVTECDTEGDAVGVVLCEGDEDGEIVDGELVMLLDEESENDRDMVHDDDFVVDVDTV